MRPLPSAVLQLLEQLPEETCKIILNTNRQGHWEIEVFTRYSVDVTPPPQAVVSLRGGTARRKGSRGAY